MSKAFGTTTLIILSAFCSTFAAAQSGWRALNSGATANLTAVHFVDTSTGYVVGAAGTIRKTTNGGTSWSSVSPPGLTTNLNGVYAFADSAGRVVVVGNGGVILLTTNGGANWTTVTSGVTVNLYSISFSSSVGISGGASQSIVRSTNAGTSWLVARSGFFGGGFWGAMMLSSEIGFVGGENSIFQPFLGKTTDSGANWTFTPFYLDSNEGRVYAVEFTDVSRGYFSCSVWDGRGAIARTTDGGITRASTFFPQPLYDIHFPTSGASQVGYAVGAGGQIVKTADAGNAWQSQSSGTSSTLRGVHFLDFNTGFAVGDGGVILKTTSGGIIVGVDENDPSSPQTFALHQNYPNPFNPTTEIRYQTSEVRYVSLKVYDLLGREVATLVNEVKPPGTYTVQWDASNQASGVYFYQLRAGGFAETRKLILEK
ncbi:MAG: T9SS type A sorting domain-containing protein [Ignavibacteriae bacterium]|nr:T9SS type A sorting domain-containing protein [Ignavibacteriota bacterium]